jgi:hypothetical protein
VNRIGTVWHAFRLGCGVEWWRTMHTKNADNRA